MSSLLLAIVALSSPLPEATNSHDHAKEAQKFKDDSTIRQPVKSPSYGGPNGTAFNDVMNASMNGQKLVGMYGIRISSGDCVHALQATYFLRTTASYEGPWHGKISNNLSNPLINISMGNEYVTKIEGKTNGSVIGQLTITTVLITGPIDYEHKVYGPFGKTGNVSFSFEGHIIGFHGKSDSALNSIGVYSLEFTQKSQEVGGPGGRPFDDRVDLKVFPFIAIYRLHIWHGDLVNAIQVDYWQLGDIFKPPPYFGDKHGGDGGNLTVVTFDLGEQIVEFQGKTGDGFVEQMIVTTKKQGGALAQYGPFGKVGKEPFSFQGNIYGIFGSSGSMVNRIGVYYLPLNTALN